MVFSRINRTVRRQKPFPGNEIQLQAGWGTGSMAGEQAVWLAVIVFPTVT